MAAPLNVDQEQVPITPQQEQWCLLVAQGKSDVAAYMEAYSSTRENAESNAWRMREYEGVISRINAINEKAESKAVLSLREKREFLAAVVRTPVGEVTEKSALCQSVKIGKDGTEYKMPGKLDAIELDAKLTGELRDAAQTTVRIAIFQAGGEKPVIDV